MKKYIPIFIVIFGLSFYLVSQGVIHTGDPTAGTPQKDEQVHSHYETVLKKLSFKQYGLKKTISFKKKMPKVIILNFWASWCTPCLEEFPSLVNLAEEFKDNDNFIILGINTDEDSQVKSVEKAQKRYSLNFPIILDKSGQYISEFSVSAIPISIIFHNGKVAEVSKGSKDFEAEEFKEKVRAWLSN